MLNVLHNPRFFFSSKCSLFHNATFFGFCIIHILNTGCAKIYECNHIVFTGNISMNIMTNQLQVDTGNHAEGGSGDCLVAMGKGGSSH